MPLLPDLSRFDFYLICLPDRDEAKHKLALVRKLYYESREDLDNSTDWVRVRHSQDSRK
jgi:hypothetical protein